MNDNDIRLVRVICRAVGGIPPRPRDGHQQAERRGIKERGGIYYRRNSVWLDCDGRRHSTVKTRRK